MEFEKMTDLAVKEEPADSADEPREVKLEMDIGPTKLQPVDKLRSLIHIKPEPVEVPIEYEDSTHTDRVQSRADTGLSVAEDDAGSSKGTYTIKRGRVGAKNDRTVLDETCSSARETTQQDITADCSRLESVNSSNKDKAKLFECTVCRKRFTAKAFLLRHLRIHSGEKPYECSICSKRFSEKRSLLVHLKIHAGEKSHECSVCSKRFITNSALLRHVRIHTGERPYECSICHKKLRRDFSEHLRIHTGEKSHECSVCSKRFITKSSLSRHMKVHTNRTYYHR